MLPQRVRRFILIVKLLDADKLGEFYKVETHRLLNYDYSVGGTPIDFNALQNPPKNQQQEHQKQGQQSQQKKKGQPKSQGEEGDEEEEEEKVQGPPQGCQTQQPQMVRGGRGDYGEETYQQQPLNLTGPENVSPISNGKPEKKSGFSFFGFGKKKQAVLPGTSTDPPKTQQSSTQSSLMQNQSYANMNQQPMFNMSQSQMGLQPNGSGMINPMQNVMQNQMQYNMGHPIPQPQEQLNFQTQAQWQQMYDPNYHAQMMMMMNLTNSREPGRHQLIRRMKM